MLFIKGVSIMLELSKVALILCQGNLHMPKDMQSLGEELRRKGISMDNDFSLSPEKLQTPLNVALAISPLFLLGSRQLANLSMGKPRLLHVCACSQVTIAC